MSDRKNPVRVGREHRCPVCNRDSWCMVGDQWVVCMRVESNRPKQMSDGSVGWLHPVDASYQPPPRRVERPPAILNVAARLREWRTGRPCRSLSALAEKLGVTNRSLEVLECGHAPYRDTWFFPMRDGGNAYTGIRLRREDGEKWAERGSHQGLFIPQCEPFGTPLIVEGPTDCAAALTAGYYAIGRPSCSGGIEHLKVAMKRMRFSRCVIVSDLDDPGLRGATTLAEHLPIPSAILVCPAKDMRMFVNNGGDRAMLDAMIQQLVWHQPKN